MSRKKVLVVAASAAFFVLPSVAIFSNLSTSEGAAFAQNCDPTKMRSKQAPHGVHQQPSSATEDCARPLPYFRLWTF